MEFRLIFDTIPDLFDKYRPRYTKELFDYLIKRADVTQDKSVLEIGPGTGQATDAILATGCKYTAIELGKNLCKKMIEKYGEYPNFSIINGDFITHDFGQAQFDLIYSSATIQWIGEEIAYPLSYNLLKSGGTLAMMFTKSDYKTTNEPLYEKIQQVYADYYKPSIEYTCGSFGYENASKYGFLEYKKKEFYAQRVLNAQEYVSYCSTHCTHLTIPEPFKTKFFDGLYSVVKQNGDKVVFNDTYVLYVVKKP